MKSSKTFFALFLTITVTIAGNKKAHATSATDISRENASQSSVEFNELSGNEKLYFSVNAPNINSNKTYAIEAIVSHPTDHSLTYDPFYSSESEGYLVAKDTVLITAAQVKQLITANPGDYYDENIKNKSGLICASIKVRINTVGWFTFDTIMRLDKFLICVNSSNKKMFMQNKSAIRAYKQGEIEAILDFK